MNPANVISTLIEIQGLSVAAARLTEYDKLSRKAALSADKVTAATAAQGKAAKESSGHVGGATKAMGGYLAAFGGYEVIKHATEATSEFYHSTQQLTQNFGLSTKAASEWGAVMQSRGVDARRLTLTFKTLSAQVKSTNDGSKTSAATFKELGISTSDLKKHGDDLQWVLGRVSDGISHMPAGTERAAISSKLFGRTWQSIAPIIRDGKKSMDEQLGSASKYGATLSGSGKSVEGMIQKQREFKLATLGLQITLGNVFMPVLLALSSLILKVDLAFRSAPPNIKLVALGVIGLSAAFGVLNIVMNMNPLARIATLLFALGAALVVAYQKSADFRQVINAIIGVLASVFNSVKGFVDGLNIHWSQIPGIARRTFGQAKEIIASVINWLTTAWRNVTTWLVTAWRNVSNYLSPAITNLGIIFRRTFEIIKTVVTPFGQFLMGVFKIAEVAFNAIIGVARILFVNAFRTAFSVVKTIINGLAPVVAGMANVIKGIIAVFAGLLTLNFTKMWNGVKQIVGGAWAAIKGIISTQIHVAIDIVTGAFNAFFNAGKFIINAIGSGIKAAWHGVLNIVSSFINALLTPINVVLGAIGVKQIHVNLGGGGGGGGGPTAPSASNLHAAGFATGGKVDRPGYFAGEEAPRHPEFILATNPAYRQRNIGLFAQAGKALGIPGFAAGGVAGNAMLWQQGGGPAAVARVAGAIAMAESNGSDIMQTGQDYAHTGWGRWQITPGNSEPQFGVDQALLIPINNAHAAVAKYVSAPHGGNNFSPWTTFTSGKYKRYLGGNDGGILGAIGSAIGSAVSSVGDLLSSILPTLPSAPHLPKPWGAIPGAILDKVTGWVKRKVGGVFGFGGGGASSGPPGLATFEGITMSKWIANELAWATQHGWHGQPTSGYRPGSITINGTPSQHGLINYPGGAVDFGGFTDPAAYATKLALVQLAQSQNYPGPRLKMPIGFHDDGHLSGTGHKTGGVHGLPYEEKLQNRFAKTTSMLKSMWRIASPSYHHQGPMPSITYTQGQDGLFVGVDFGGGGSRRGGPGHRPLYIPDWVVAGQPGEAGLNKMNPTMLELLLHEWTHEFQRADIISKIKTPKNVDAFEGGAEANAQRIAPTILKALGARTNFDRSSYTPDRKWVEKHLGRNWIANKQFGYKFGGSFAKGGIVNAKGPTVAVFGENGPETAMFIPHFAQGGAFSGLTGHGAPGRTGATISFAPSGAPAAATTSRGFRGALGIPPLPSIGGSAGTTIGSANSLAGRVGSLQTSLGNLQESLTVMDAIFNLTQTDLLDPDTGLRNETNISAKAGQIKQLVDIAHQAFNVYGRIIVLSKRLVETYANVVHKFQVKKRNADVMVGQLKSTLAQITTRGLKGAPLKRAQKHQADLRASIAKYGRMSSSAAQGIQTYGQKESDTAGTITGLMNDRDNSWIEWQQRLNEWHGVLSTKAQPTAAATDTSGVTSTDAGTASTATDAGTAAAAAPTVDPALIAALQNFAVSQRQYAVFAGLPKFAAGGIASGLALVGEHGPEIASFTPGTRIYSNSDSRTMMAPTIQVIVLDDAVDTNKIQVIAEGAAVRVTRGQSRTGTNASRLPGSRGGM